MGSDGLQTILLLDENPDRGAHTASLLKFAEYRVIACNDPGEAETADPEDVLAVVAPTDIVQGPWEGLMKRFRKAEVPLVAVDDGEKNGVRLGSEFFARLSQPLHYAQLSNCLRRARSYRLSRRLDDKSLGGGAFRPMVGKSRPVETIRRMITQVAATDASVLILGESGTGKEVIAQNIHILSDRRDKPFVPLNCGAIPGDLLESELFGHEKGAFTGAITSRQGRFEMAEGGTLFLDEIGDMPMPMQVKLLRVLQERTFERVGGKETIRANVRVIAATHRDLEARIRDGEFREDLYYRLNVFPIETAPLRKITDDLPQLIDELVARIEQEGRGTLRLSSGAIEALKQYEWPGNVRELNNLIERLAIIFPDEVVQPADLPERYREGIDVDDLPQESPAADAPEVAMASTDDPASAVRLPDDGLKLKDLLRDIEVSLIEQALERADGVVAQAARLLDVRRTTLVEKLRKYDIPREL